MIVKVVQAQTIFTACQELLKNIDASDISCENFVIVPDRFSLQVEDLIMDTLGISSTFNIEVMGLTRLSTKVLGKIGVKGQLLNNDDVLLLTQQAIENVKAGFSTFKKTSISFAQEVSKVITQFKSSNLAPNEIKPKNCSKAVENKYNDLGLIYEEYERLISARLDRNKLLILLAQSLEKTDVLKNVNLYLVGFDSFTAQMFSCITALAKVCKSLSISLASPTNPQNDYIYEKDILQKLVSLCQSEGIMVQVEERKAPLSLGQERIVSLLYSGATNLPKDTCGDFLSSILCRSLYEEVLTVGKIINNYIRQGGRYRDCVIACSDLEKYMPYINRAFDELDIPFFADRAVTADKLILSNAIFKFLKVVSSGYSRDSLADFFSMRLTQNEFSQDICATIAEHNISQKGKVKKYLSHLAPEQIKLFENLKAQDTCENYVACVRKFLDYYAQSYEKILDNLAKDYPEEENLAVQAEKYIDMALESILRYQANYNISIGEFIKKLELLLSFNQVSTVPTYVDSVMIGDATKSYFSPCKKLFVLAGGDILPQVVADSGLVSDKEISSVNLIRLIEPSIRMLNRRNRFKLFNLLTLAKEELYVTYRATGDDGKKIEKPAFLTQLCQIFNQEDIRASLVFSPNNGINDEMFISSLGSRQHAIKLLARRNGDISNKRFSSLQKVLKVDVNKFRLDRDYIDIDSKKLFFPKDYTKVTQLECYFSCPFKHFVRYGLKLQDNKLAEFQQREIGNICHKMAEIFVRKNMNNLGSLMNSDVDKFIEQNLDWAIKDLALDELLDSTTDKNALILFIKGQVRLILCRIVFEQKLSRFKPIYLEKELDGMSIPVEGENQNIALKGKVDRIDKFDGYFRILDYKTGKVGSLIKDLYYGDKLQLFIYQKGVSDMLGLTPSGVFYFDCKFDLYDQDQGNLLKGLIAKNDEVIEASDSSLGMADKSSLMSIKTYKKPEKEKYYGNSIAKGSLYNLQTYATQVASKALGEIYQGYIEPKPDEDACSKCDYKGICLYNSTGGVRIKSTASFDQINNIIKGGSDE